MEKFSAWLENEEKDFNYWSRLLVNYLGLSQDKGLSVNISSLDQQDLTLKLQGLGEFSQLPSDTQQMILDKINSQNPGTIGDLVRAISSNDISM